MSTFDPERLLKTLARRRVRYVLIGAVAARLQGFPRMTADTDIAPARDEQNLKRLAAALRDIKAKVYTESVPDGLPFDCSPEAIASAEAWNLVRSAGRVDILFEPSGTKGYEGLAPTSVPFTVFGVEIVQRASKTFCVRRRRPTDHRTARTSWCCARCSARVSLPDVGSAGRRAQGLRRLGTNAGASLACDCDLRTSPASRKKSVQRSVATSSAIEGIHAPFKTGTKLNDKRISRPKATRQAAKR